MQSRFFVDRSCDTYLAYVVGHSQSLTGAYYEGEFFGATEVMMDLEELFGDGSLIENLQKLSDPMNGQQKNFLIAIATVVQTPVSSSPIVADSKNVVLKPEMWRNFNLVQNDKVTIKRFVNKVEVSYNGREYGSFHPLLFDKNSVLQSIALKECGVSVQERRAAEEKILVMGSRMNIRSGVWHDQFAELLSDYGYRGWIKFVDFNEEPRRQMVGKFKCEWLFPKEKITGYTVLIDDAQLGDMISDVVPACRRYSLKKKGKGYFNFERRSFSLVDDILPFNIFTECQCERCSAAAFCAYRLGGYPAFQRIQLELSKLGPVCVKERLEERNSILACPERFNPDKVNRYKEELRKDECHYERSFIYQQLRDRKVYIAAYYSEFKGSKHFQVYSDYDVAVVSNVISLVDIGFPNEIVSQENLELHGYDVEYREGWRFYTRKKTPVACPSFEIRVKI